MTNESYNRLQTLRKLADMLNNSFVLSVAILGSILPVKISDLCW